MFSFDCFMLPWMEKMHLPHLALMITEHIITYQFSIFKKNRGLSNIIYIPTNLLINFCNPPNIFWVPTMLYLCWMMKSGKKNLILQYDIGYTQRVGLTQREGLSIPLGDLIMSWQIRKRVELPHTEWTRVL